MLTIQQANEQLQTAYQKNPGPWVEHSRSVAENVRRIAEHTDCIDPDTAYTMGLLHDIGRAAGVSGIRHIFDGYDRMIALGQPTIARICLTHSFPLKNIRAFQGSFDCSKQQLAFLQRFLDSCSYDKLRPADSAVRCPFAAKRSLHPGKKAGGCGAAPRDQRSFSRKMECFFAAKTAL
ncbi:MAG: HD domain-containing protein [Negativibacillus sp.]